MNLDEGDDISEVVDDCLSPSILDHDVTPAPSQKVLEPNQKIPSPSEMRPSLSQRPGSSKFHERSSKTPSSFNIHPPLHQPPTHTGKGKKKETRFEANINKLESIAKMTAAAVVEEDEHEKYARYIASQLRLLPERSVVILQNQIHNLIAQERLNSIENRNQQPRSIVESNESSIFAPDQDNHNHTNYIVLNENDETQIDQDFVLFQ